jgi:hypothetical protein
MPTTLYLSRCRLKLAAADLSSKRRVFVIEVIPCSQSLQQTQPERLARPSPCVFCGYNPSISLSYTAIVREFLEGAVEYADLFQTLGIFSDMHFRILLGMEMEDRCDFFRAYVPKRLMQFGLLDLTERIEDFRSSHPWAALSLMPISRKKSGSDFEDFLSKSPSLKLVAHCMHFSTEEYQILVVRPLHAINLLF